MRPKGCPEIKLVIIQIWRAPSPHHGIGQLGGARIGWGSGWANNAGGVGTGVARSSCFAFLSFPVNLIWSSFRHQSPWLELALLRSCWNRDWAAVRTVPALSAELAALWDSSRYVFQMPTADQSDTGRWRLKINMRDPSPFK